MRAQVDEQAANREVAIEVRRLGNGWWKASFPGIAGAEVTGRSLAALRRRVRETLMRLRPEHANFAIIEDLRFRPDLKQMVADVIEQHTELEAKRLAVHRQLTVAVKRLRANGLSVRDAAAVLGISRAYVQLLGRIRRGRPPASHRPGRPRRNH